MLNKYVLLLSLFPASLLSAQTFTGSGGLIPDNGNSIDFTINVSGLSPATIDTSTFGLETVCIDLTHTYDSDLDISLVAPDGTSVTLTSGNGGNGQNYTNTCFDVTAPTSIALGSPPFTGTFKPQGLMGIVNNGQNGNGNWKLHINDTYPFADQGTLISWSITFGTNPATYWSLQSSNLPIVIVNTGNEVISDDPKVRVNFGIIYNGPGVRNYMTDPFHYSGLAGMEFRGSSSQMFPKKPYGVELWAADSSALDTGFIGLPSESDWILNPNYSDKTLLHNVLSYDLSEKMGHYATRWRMVELVINGQYEGVYILSEKIKRDKNRVDISKLTPVDNTAPDVTGGYIFKIDKTTGSGGNGWTSNYAPAVSGNGQTIYFQYEYPKETEITPQQQAYIAAFVDSFETALYNNNFDTATGWRRYAKQTPLVDYFLLNELSRNVDGYRLSTYLYKHKITKGGKLHIGPVWDYDIAWHNANYCNGQLTTGWAYQFGNDCPGDYWQIPMWWDHLLQDTNFTKALRCRWEQLKVKFLSVNSLHGWLDSMAVYLNEGQQRNFTRWPILGTWVWPNSSTPPTYQGEIDELKQWISARWNWLDANIPGVASNCEFVGLEENFSADGLTVYPNPFEEQVSLLLDLGEATKADVRLLNVAGQEVLHQTQQLNYGPQRIDLSVRELPAGLYVLQVRTKAGMLVRKVVKK